MSTGTDLYVETLGPRHAMTSLLFLHGGMGLDHTYFRPFVDPLADVAQLVFMDHRLNGRSPRTSTRPVTLRTMVEQFTRRVLARTSFSAHGFNTFVASALGQIDYRDALPALEVPALFIAGSSDWFDQDPGGGSKAAARLAPRGTCITLDESGHFPFAEQPWGFCAAIRGWLRTEIA